VGRRFKFNFSAPKHPSPEVVRLSAAELERLLLRKLRDEADSPCQALWELAQFYKRERRHDEALRCLQQLQNFKSDPEAQANCLLTKGQIEEQRRDFAAAIRCYREALAFEPASDFTWYFLHNNLGFCLTATHRFTEAEFYCRKAIEIDPARSNGYKNLGLSLHGQHRFEEAAQAYVDATRVDAADSRSLALLDLLLADHPELQERFAAEAQLCRQAVETAAREIERHQPTVLQGWRKKWFLARVRLNSLRRRLRQWLNRRSRGPDRAADL
jgi:tetratricopeptide (TPR) repeat protein